MNFKVTKTFQLFDKDIIDKYGNDTGWFNPASPLSRLGMYDNLILDAGFSREQALVIMASLGLIGVQFSDDTIVIDE